MAKRRKLQMESTAPNGDPITTNIGYVNPNLTTTADYQKIEQAVTALNGLTRNTYVETLVIDTEPLSELVTA